MNATPRVSDVPPSGFGPQTLDEFKAELESFDEAALKRYVAYAVESRYVSRAPEGFERYSAEELRRLIIDWVNARYIAFRSVFCRLGKIRGEIQGGVAKAVEAVVIPPPATVPLIETAPTSGTPATATMTASLITTFPFVDKDF